MFYFFMCPISFYNEPEFLLDKFIAKCEAKIILHLVLIKNYIRILFFTVSFNFLWDFPKEIILNNIPHLII